MAFPWRSGSARIPTSRRTPGDHGLHFASIPGAKMTTPQVTKGDEVLWPLIDQETAREPQPV
jgi:hypothetical protein